MEKLLCLRDVNKIYNTDEVKFHALYDIHLDVKNKDFLAVIGPSGSGKSTLLHIIGLLDRPTSGKVIFDNKDISRLNDNQLARLRCRKIGFIFQFFNLHPRLTAKENVELPMMISDVDAAERDKRSRELLRLVELEHRGNHLPSQLSGGERQRVAIARALSNNPDLILADEPTGNLDTKSGENIIKLLEKLNNTQKKTIIIITHDERIASHTKKKIYLRDGKIVKRVVR